LARRSVCRTHFPSPFASCFFQRWQQAADPRDLVGLFPVSLRTLQRLFARFEQRGADGVAPDYGRCGQDQGTQTPPSLVQQLCDLRRQHPRWGAELLRLHLAGGAAVPCARTLQRHLRAAGLQPAPAGRPPAPAGERRPRAEHPHQGWQSDAAEELGLQGRQQASWLRIVDECSGAFLQTSVFAAGRWEHVDRHQIQEALRQAFGRWGLPEWFRVDNGYPWGSTGDFPPEMALWLIGLGIEVVWIPPGCPQQNGVVERAQGTGQNWAEPHTCRQVAELQQRCDALDRLQRERYPYRGDRSRWQVYPELRHSGRPYRRRAERSLWDVTRAWAAVAQRVAKRQVDCTGSVSLYHRTRYVGKAYSGQVVYVSLDPSGPTWVFANAAGQELRTHAAAELTAERICSLSVAGRKGKRSRA
jgi:hypothetical protein